MKKVAFIVQRCGLEVNGGAESHCLSIAKQMSAHWKTEILTTCAVDYLSWKNYYPAGIHEVSGVKVRRFPVAEERNINKFNEISDLMRPHINAISTDEQESWMRLQGPWSPDLINFVKNSKGLYDAFIFFAYLYATTYFVLPLVKDKAFLAPLAHDEWPIYFSMWNKLFNMPRAFIFNTNEEKDFLKTRFPQSHLKGPVVGVAVDPPGKCNGKGFRQRYNIKDPFLLYVGRIDPEKGCNELLECFLNFNKKTRFKRKLVLLGKPVMEIPIHPDIISLGFVDEQTKWDALAESQLLVMPSPYESLSMVLLEAWSMGKPVLVNGRCKVLVGQCRRSQGGLWYENQAEFETAVEELAGEKGFQLGEQGKKFVQKEYSWPVIKKAYLNLVQ